MCFRPVDLVTDSQRVPSHLVEGLPHGNRGLRQLVLVTILTLGCLEISLGTERPSGLSDSGGGRGGGGGGGGGCYLR